MITEISFEGIDKIGDYDIKNLGKINLIIPHSYDCGTWFEYFISGILDGLNVHKKLARVISLYATMLCPFGAVTVEDVVKGDLPQSSVKIIADDSSFVKVDFLSNRVNDVSSSEHGEFFTSQNEQNNNWEDQSIFNMHEAFYCYDNTNDIKKTDRKNGILLLSLIDNQYSPLEEYDYIANVLEHKNDYGQIFIISYSYFVLKTLKNYAYKHHKEIKLVSLYEDNRLVSDWLENEPENQIDNEVRILYEENCGALIGEW